MECGWEGVHFFPSAIFLTSMLALAISSLALLTAELQEERGWLPVSAYKSASKSGRVTFLKKGSLGLVHCHNSLLLCLYRAITCFFEALRWWQDWQPQRAEVVKGRLEGGCSIAPGNISAFAAAMKVTQRIFSV